MPLPAQVRQQVDGVKKLYEDMNKPDDPVDANPNPPAEGTEGNPPQEPAQPSPAPTKDNKETWEQKYRTLQGMYNADVPRLQAQANKAQQEVKALSERVQQLEALLGSVQKPPADPKPKAGNKFVTDEDVETFGEESISMMRRAAREEAAAAYEPVIEELRAKISELSGELKPQITDVKEEQAKQAVAKFWADFEGAVPNWRAINDEPEFKTWLLAADPLTGQDKQSFLAAAQARRDGLGVAKFFLEWERIKKGDNPNPNPSTRDTKQDLEDQIAPGRGRASAPPEGETKTTWKRDEISAFYAEVTKGDFKGREAEKARIEADIIAAGKEGRITQ
jgi:hypothetical protein